jgi:hypothetical protein
MGVCKGGNHDVYFGNDVLRRPGRTVVHDSNFGSRSLEFIQGTGGLRLCVSSDTSQYPNTRTYSTGQGSHIVDFPIVLELHDNIGHQRFLSRLRRSF